MLFLKTLIIGYESKIAQPALEQLVHNSIIQLRDDKHAVKTNEIIDKIVSI